MYCIQCSQHIRNQNKLLLIKEKQPKAGAAAQIHSGMPGRRRPGLLTLAPPQGQGLQGQSFSLPASSAGAWLEGWQILARGTSDRLGWFQGLKAARPDLLPGVAVPQGLLGAAHCSLQRCSELGLRPSSSPSS